MTAAPKQIPLTKKRLLLVDDDEVSLRYYSACLSREHYEIQTALDAAIAKEIITKNKATPFDCIVSDYLMPGETGLELLQWVLEQDPTLASIMITSESEKQRIMSSLRIGVTDFLEKPIRRDLFQTAIANACQITQDRRQQKESQNAVRKLASLQSTMAVSREGGLGRSIITRVLPRHELGGDFLDVIEKKDGTSLMVCGDVSGHDLNAAYISAYFQGMVQGLLSANIDVPEIVSQFNLTLIRRFNTSSGSASNTFSLATAFLEYDPSEQSLSLCNCGFPPPLLCGRDGAMNLIEAHTPPLGWFEDAEYERIKLDNIHSAYIYCTSDGILDLADAIGVNPYSITYKLLHDSDPSSTQELVNLSRDDILIICIPLDAPTSNGMSNEFFEPIIFEDLTHMDPKTIDAQQLNWEHSLTLALGTKIWQDRLPDIILCMREAVLNAITHGRNTRKNNVIASFEASFQAASKTLRLRIKDTGTGYHFDIQERMAALDTLQEDHFGLVMLHSFSDAITFEANGATVTMDFHLNKDHDHDTN